MCNKVLTGLLLAVCLSACSQNPAKETDELASGFGFERLVVTGTEFRHVVYVNRHTGEQGALHVYLEGDGSPWVGERRVATDPGPRNPLMLKLMALDTAPAVYLGRPCYHGLSDQPPCHPALWTAGRYSPQVLASMARALQSLLSSAGSRDIVLIGHSGGGTLAMLLAARVPDVRAVVTLAGNLDTDAWVRLHEYSNLATSLNPATQAPLPAAIYQLHVAAERDTVVPAALIVRAAARQPHADTRIVPGADHTCCWQSVWPSLLATLADKMARTPGRE